MQRMWYYLMRAYVKLGLYFYFKEIQVLGKEKIPKKGAVLLCPNHQNAFMDALLVATHCGRSSHYLVRADIFNKPIANWLLSSLNMMPIFRIRDGRKAMEGNDAIFNKCGNLLLNKEAILVFPEGDHSLQRRLRPLSKGFTRLVSSALKMDPTLEVQIVPVGINYEEHRKYRTSVSIYYGEPISASQYFKKNAPLELRDSLSEEIKKLITHIDPSNYDETKRQLDLTDPNYLNPAECNARIATLGYEEGHKPKPTKKSNILMKVLALPFYLINFLPLKVWKSIKAGIKASAFEASIKYCVGIAVFPIYYAALLGLSFVIYPNPWMVIAIFGLLIVSMPLNKYLNGSPK